MIRKTRCGPRPAPCSSRPSSCTASSSSRRGAARALGAAGRRVRDRARALHHRRAAGCRRPRRCASSSKARRSSSPAPAPCRSDGRNANILRLEIPYGRFERRIALAAPPAARRARAAQRLPDPHLRQILSERVPVETMNDIEQTTPRSAEAPQTAACGPRSPRRPRPALPRAKAPSCSSPKAR